MVHRAYNNIWLQPTPLAEHTSYLSTASKDWPLSACVFTIH